MSIGLLYVADADEEALGNYIFAANPYEAGFPPPNTWVTEGGPPATVTLVPANSAHDEPYMLDFAGNEVHEKPGQWKFKYADHFVQRAARIPYMYYQKSKADPALGILTRDYFLIGFEGGAGY